MTEEDVVACDAVPPADLKRKLESEVLDQDAGSIEHSNEFSVNDGKESSDSFQAKRPKLDQEADVGLGNAESQENDTPTEKGKEDSDEEKREVTEKLTEQKDDNQDGEAPVEEVQEPVLAEEPENMVDDVDQFSVDNDKHENNQLTSVEAATSQEGSFEESKEVKTGSSQMNFVDESKEANDAITEKEVEDQCKEMNGGSQKKDYDETMEAHGGGSQKENGDKSKEANGDSSHKEIGDGGEEVDDSQSTTRRIDVPSSKVGVLIGKGGETIRYLQFNSGAKIQIMRDAEADPNSALRPVEIIGNVACIEKAERLIKAVIAESEAGGSPALVARGFRASHATGVPEQMEIKVPNDKVGVIIGRGGETIKSMQTKSRARIQLVPQHAEADGSKERTVRISGDKRQIDIAAAMIKDVMYQDGRPSHFPGGYDQSAYQSRGRGGPPQWDSRGPHVPHQVPYDHRHGGPYPSQGSHFRPPSSGDYYPPHMPPRSGYGPGWDQRPPHSGSYDYYGRQGAPTPAPRPTPGPLSSPALGPPPSEASYGYRYGQGPDYVHPAPYSQAGTQHNYGQTYDQPKYDNPYSQQPYGGYGGSQQGFPAAGGQPGYPQMQQPGRSYGMQGPAEQGYGPPRPAAIPGDVPYKVATPVAPSYGTNMSQQQQYGYASSAPGQQTYSSYNSAVPSDGYNGTQAPATTTAYEQHGVQQASGHDQSGVQQASVGYGQAPPTGGYSSYPSTQPGYGNTVAQNNGNYGHTTSQYPGYGGGNTLAYAAPGGQPAYSQTAPAQAGYEQSATQTAGYTAAPGTAQ